MSVTLEVNAVRYGGWTDIRIERSLETISGCFSLGVTERWPGQDIERAIKPGDDCKVRIGNDIVITGRIDDVDPSLDAESHNIQASGRDYSGTLVDCSVIHKPGQWNGQKLEKIASDLVAPFGKLKVLTQANTGEAFRKFAIEQGETVHEAIERMCKLRAVLCITDGQGNLILTTAGKNRTATALIEGENIKRIQGHFSVKDRFSDVYVKGQTQGSRGHSANVTTGCKGHARDPEILPYRPLLIVAEGQANTKQCQERAEWEIATRKGKGTRISVVVQGWRQRNDDSSPLWEINSLAYVESLTHKIRETLLIAGVVYTLDDQGGQQTEITLVKPEAFKLIREPESA